MATKAIPVVAGKVAATLADYPAYIKPSAMTGWAAITLAEAQSIRFYSDEAKTTELAREVVSADEIHVKVTSLTTSTTIYADYDGVRADYAVTDTYGRNAVWGGYLFVGHMEDSGTIITDSTGRNNGTVNDTRVTGSASGIAGLGADLTASVDDHVNIFDTKDEVDGKGALTTSLWVKKNENRYSHLNHMQNQATFAAILWFTYLGDNKIQLGARSQVSDTFRSVISPSAYTSLDWHHLAGVVDFAGGNLNLYRDGSSIVSASASWSLFTLSVPSTIRGYRWGVDNSTNTRSLNGLMDECRIYNGVLSANWIATEYNNQDDVATFWGTVTDAGGAPVAKNGFMAWL